MKYLAAVVAIVVSSGVYNARAETPVPVLDIGPPSAFGESAAETAEKRVVFEYTALMMAGRQQQAFETYVSPDFRDHSHLIKAVCKCANPGYTEALAFLSRKAVPGKGPPPSPGLPKEADVDEDIVTMYYPGVDIFRVKDGKITDHWDASPPAAISLPAEKPFPKNP